MGTSLQKPWSDLEPFLQNTTKSTQLNSLNTSGKIRIGIQKTKTDKTASYSGDDKNPPPTNKTSPVEEMFLRDETTKELYMLLSSTVVLKWKVKKCSMTLQISRMA